MAFNTQNIIDPTNNPALVILNNITLPGDVIITTSEEKVIAESKILDGVMVFERLSRKPMEIGLTFTFREVNTGQYVNSPLGKYTFPQYLIEQFQTSVWEVDAILPVQNTFLNGIGIYDVVFKSKTMTTIRGNTDVLCSMKCLELFGSVTQPQSLTIVPVGS